VVFISEGEYIDVSNDVLNEQERDDWCFLKPSGIEFYEYVSCDAIASVCEIQSVNQVMQDHFNCEDEGKEEEEVEEELTENKVSFFNALH
jgi:hypothetical protein